MCALRFVESFDHYATGDLAEKWTTNSFCALGTGTGRRGTNSMRQSSYNSWLGLTLTNEATWIVGCAVRITAYPTSGPAGIFEWQDAGGLQGRLLIGVDGTLRYQRGLTDVGSPSTASIALSTYTYLEWLLTIDNTVGVSQARLNGVVVLNLTGIDTQATGNASANILRIGNHGSSNAFTFGTEDVDDVYVCDGTGSPPHNGFLGDCRVDVLLPTGDGTYSAWTPSTGTTHSTLVDDAMPNDDTDYLSTSAAAARESHGFANAPSLTTPLIYGVQHLLSARKDDAASRSIMSLVKSGGVTQVGATVHGLTTSYRYYREVWITDPNTGGAWTVSGIDGLEAGLENQ